MYMRETRWERRIAEIESAVKQGKFGVWLYLYSSEYRKLKKMGFTLTNPEIPYTKSQKVWVSWRNLQEFILESNEPIYRYLTLQVDTFPDTKCFSDACFVKAMRSNLEKCLEPSFVNIFLNMLRHNCCF